MTRVAIGMMLLSAVLLLAVSGLASSEGDSTASPTVTPTPIPPDASVEAWQALMTPTEACPLPCWWGITPGETTVDELEAFFNTTFEGIDFSRRDFEDNTQAVGVSDFFMQVEGESVPPISITSKGQGGIVQYLNVSMPERSSFGIEPALAWQYFDVLNLLETYGTPSQISAFAAQRPQGLQANTLILYWDDIGVLIEYEHKSFSEDLVWGQAICFDYLSLESADILLQNPQSELSLLSRSIQLGISEGTRHITDISDFTVAEFAQLLLDNQGCLPPDLPVEW